tara:strand:+ start:18728 stop:19372 length:645 start_codon:yes stop_codon:yes gene_type:complete
MNNNLDSLIDLYKDESANVFKNIPNSEITSMINLIWETYQTGGTVFCCGNGGNAGFVANLVSDFALHPFVAEDKSKALNIEKRFSVIDLTCSSTMITGLLNDLGANHIFSGQIKVHAKPGDLVIGFSGSGNSGNILTAFEESKRLGGRSLMITRNKNGKCAQHCDVIVEVPGNSTYPGQTGKNNNNFHFEDCLSKLTHLVTGILKGRIQNEIKC